MSLNLLIPTHHFSSGVKSVISTKWAAKYLNVSYEAFKKEVDHDNNLGAIKWQSKIEDQDNSRPILGFMIEYLDELMAIIGRKRTRGTRLFTDEIKHKFNAVNQRWLATERPIDWNKDSELTSKAMKRFVKKGDKSNKNNKKPLK